jgi:predicted Rossmann-fold nucleotide-binding protein
MWDKIGGKGTFDELLKILEEVKEELKAKGKV